MAAPAPDRGETGIGLVVVGAWLTSIQVLAELDLRVAFRDPLFDLVVTAAIAGYALVRLRRLTTRETLALIALALFVWLTTLRGDVITLSGQWLGLPVVVVVVLGVAWTLLTSSAFATGSSAKYPRQARALLWLGYLVLSTTILLWIEVTHGDDVASEQGRVGFVGLGIPIAAWLWMRRSVAGANVDRTPIAHSSSSRSAA